MMKLKIYLTAFFLGLSIYVHADEGMWLLPLLDELNMTEMTEMGLELKYEQIYNENGPGLKDAVGALDYGSCTAELVSPNGLLFTNHHCGYGEIQSHSTKDHNYLADGFWAGSYEEELPNPGKSVSFIVRIEEVGDRINAELNCEMSEDERQFRIESVSADIEAEATSDNHYEAYVRPFFEGNRFFLIVAETFRDVRLVGAPPESIGKFGHDTDNWMWPRHTGDFSIFRVYTGPDGKPADYHVDNIPLKSRHYFPISLKGYDKHDFSMVLGFPGSTDRYMTSRGVRELLEVVHPNRIKIRSVRQEIMMEDMLASEEVYIQYASKYSRSSNYWKYSIGQSKGLRELNVLEEKQELEERFNQWVRQDKRREEKYGEALEMIEFAVQSRKQVKHVTQYIGEAFIHGVEFIGFAFNSFPMHAALLSESDDPAERQDAVERLRESAGDFFKNFNPSTEKKIALAMLRLFADHVDKSYHPDLYATINKRYRGDYEKYVRKIFKKSIFVDRERMMDFLADPDKKTLSKDLVFQAARSIYHKYLDLRQSGNEFDERFQKGRRLYIAGLREMDPELVRYPDANSTLRLTYGTTEGYYARDAVYYKHYTTLEGVMEKEDPDNPEFIVPDKLKSLYENKDYGPYGENDVMKVCFITNHDITGGNSGSPVIDKEGNLIGIAFDGNWEAMSGDVSFEEDLQRCIGVDIRYVLFIIDKFAGAQNLIQEMTLVL